MKHICVIPLLLSLPLFLGAQEFRHYDFLGAGHNREVRVTSSSANTGSPNETVDGFTLQNPDQLKDASRFLAQCTFGADMPTIQMAAAMGYEAWLDEQFSLPQPSIIDEMYRHWKLLNEEYEEEEIGEDPEFIPNLFKPWFHAAWFNHNLTTPDLLRNRMAFTWSQIMVINNNSDFFEDISQIGATFYETLAEGCI